MNLSFRRQQETKRREERKRSMPWREYWHLYLSLIGTGILTAFAGIYLGLAPEANGNIVFVSQFDMVRRVFFALYYALSFLLVAEGATLFAKDKLLQRDVEEIDGRIADIAAQRNSMTAMLWVSVLAIMATTVAAGYILAAWLRALDQFVTIPAVAQIWVVAAPPVLLVFDAVCTLIYQQNSKQSELDRWVQQQKRMAEANAQEMFAHTYVQEYNRVAPDAARRAASTSAMTDARKWAGSGVDEEPVTPVHDQEATDRRVPSVTEKPYQDFGTTVMELPKHHWDPSVPFESVRPTESGNATGLSQPHEKPQPGDVVIEESHDAMMPAHLVPPAEDNHGVETLAVTEENTMTPPASEVGTDQPSPT